MEISRAKLEETKKLAKFVTLNIKRIYEEGLPSLIEQYYIPSVTEETEKLSKDPELAIKIEKIRKTLDGNDYGCQEIRTRKIFGLMLDNNENLFIEGSTKSSTDFQFESYQSRYPYIVVVPIDNTNSHNYFLNYPTMLIGSSSAKALKHNGKIGNRLPNLGARLYLGKDLSGLSTRLATETEIDSYFERLLLLCSPDSESPLEVDSKFPVLTGELGRTLRKFMKQYPTLRLPETETETVEI